MTKAEFVTAAKRFSKSNDTIESLNDISLYINESLKNNIPEGRRLIKDQIFSSFKSKKSNFSNNLDNIVYSNILSSNMIYMYKQFITNRRFKTNNFKMLRDKEENIYLFYIENIKKNKENFNNNLNTITSSNSNNTKNSCNNNYITYNPYYNIHNQYIDIENYFLPIYSENKGFRIRHGFCMIPHLKKISRGGEDAIRVLNNLVVIADGVGGWNVKGVDPSLFSRQLVNNVVDSFLNEEKELKKTKININNNNNIIESYFNKETKLKKIIQKAINKTINIKGSSTLSLFSINPLERKGYSVVIGDSLIMIVKLSKKTKKFYLNFISKEQSHGFNIPYQVGYDCDSTEYACIVEHDLEDKDIVIVASDGLWDNLSLKLILNLINQVVDSEFNIVDCNFLAQLLVKSAQVVSLNK